MSINNLMDEKDKWKAYLTLADSLWLFRHDGESKKFHGAFVSQVADNLILRYSKAGELVLDLFGGSGTAERAARRLGRKSLLVDLNYKDDQFTNKDHLRYSYNSAKPLSSLYEEVNAALTILHPPYYDVVRFSDRQQDLSTMTRENFISSMLGVYDNADRLTKRGGFVSLVFGDVYKKGTLWPAYELAELVPDNWILKAIFVKNITGNEGAKGKNGNLWRYRALKSGFGYFAHEYIYVWAKF